MAVLRGLLSVITAVAFLVLAGYLSIRATLSRDGLRVDLTNAPVQIQDPAVPWPAYLLLALAAGVVLVLCSRRGPLLPAVVAASLLVLTAVLLATGPAGRLSVFEDDRPAVWSWALRGADSPAVHVLIVVLGFLAVERSGLLPGRRPTSPDAGPASTDRCSSDAPGSA